MLKYMILATVCFALVGCFPRVELDPIVVSDSSVGPITTNTQFSSNEIQSLFPGCGVNNQFSTAEGVELPSLEIDCDEYGELEVKSDASGTRVGRVIIHSGELIESHEGKLGDSFSDVFRENSANCLPGGEEYTGSIFCRAPGLARVQYVFQGSWSGPDDRIPPLQTLAAWNLHEIHWQP